MHPSRELLGGSVRSDLAGWLDPDHHCGWFVGREGSGGPVAWGLQRDKQMPRIRRSVASLVRVSR